MNGHGFAGLVSDWSRELDSEIASRPEVCVAVAEAHAGAFEWQRLKAMLESGDWSELDCLRLANCARMKHHEQNPDGKTAEWRKATEKAADTGPVALERLARLAQTFGWEQECNDVLWRLSLEPQCPRWAAESLWQTSLQNGNAARLASSSRLMAAVDPLHERRRNAEIVAAMLRRSNESAVWQFAAALRAATPKDATLAAIHALALNQQGRTAEANAVIASLNSDKLNEPRSALYFGIFLTASRRQGDAAEYFEKAGAASLLIEEKALMGKAAAAAQAATK